MEALVIIIPAIIVALYILGQQGISDKGESIIQARSRRIAEREEIRAKKVYHDSDIIAERDGVGMRRDGQFVNLNKNPQ